MDKKCEIPFVLSIIGMCLPIFSAGIMCLVEKELSEAIFSGLFIGSIAGTAFGMTALVLDRKVKRKVVIFFSCIPAFMVCLYFILFAATGAYF